MRYDFHSHSHYSDGVLSPSLLIDRAIEKDKYLLAMTDHDSVDGLQEAHQYIQSNNLNIRLINGLEISAQSDFGEIHIVGLNVDPCNNNLLALTQAQQKKRWDRVERMEEKFIKLNINGVLDYLKEHCKQVVTRSHVAKALVALGYAKDNNQAFKKLIGKKGRVKVATEWISMEEAIETIHQAGGMAILAHPTRYPMSNRRLGYLIEDFSQNKGDAIEVSYPSLSPDKKAWLEIQRTNNNLLASAGSDFHYPNLKWSDLGCFASVDPESEHVLSRL